MLLMSMKSRPTFMFVDFCQLFSQKIWSNIFSLKAPSVINVHAWSISFDFRRCFSRARPQKNLIVCFWKDNCTNISTLNNRKFTVVMILFWETPLIVDIVLVWSHLLNSTPLRNKPNCTQGIPSGDTRKSVHS